MAFLWSAFIIANFIRKKVDNMIPTKQQLKENLIHVNSQKAKKSAIQDGVFICSNKAKNEFLFIPLEDVMYQGKPLRIALNSLEKQIKDLNEMVDKKIEMLTEQMNSNQKQMIESINILTAIVNEGRTL